MKEMREPLVLSKFFAPHRLSYAPNFGSIVARFARIRVQRVGEFRVRNFEGLPRVCVSIASCKRVSRVHRYTPAYFCVCPAIKATGKNPRYLAITAHSEAAYRGKYRDETL